MYLKRIEMQGFKSFANPVTIDFKDGITCIVGPNGSGKSNITDAMRWVLGEQSAKTLRGGKMEDVIFAGTETRKSKGMAEVTLIFDNQSGILPIDYSEVSIRRRLFRSGESEYYINNNQCRLRDIKELIMDTGIGVDGYSFIGQGRVNKIINEPNAKREILEEAAGIIKYKSRKHAAQNKLDAANLNLDRLNDIIMEIESRIGGLKEESEKAKEHAGLAARHRELDINITLRNIENVKEKFKELTEQSNQTGLHIEAKRAEKLRLETELTMIRNRVDEQETTLTDLREQLAENKNRTLAVSSSAALSEERRLSAERDKARVSAEIEVLKVRAAEEELRVHEVLVAKEDADANLVVYAEKFNEKLAEAAAAAAEFAALNSEAERKKTSVFELSRERSIKEAELKNNLELIGNFDIARERLASELQAARLEKEDTEKSTSVLVEKKDILETEIAKLRTDEDAARAEYEKYSKEVDRLRAESEAMKLKTEQLSSRRKTIEEMESNYEGYTSGIKALMKSGISGIEGVVAELIEANSGYETAVETALGASLQFVVCRDDKSAKDAIKWLKDNKAGRLTFLPLETIRSRKKPASKQMEGIAGFEGYAYDKVKADSKYRQIIEYLIGNAVISNNLDSAVSLSKQNSEGYKIVSKEGDVVNPGGALTGGAFRHRSADLLSRKAEIKQLESELAEYKVKVAELDLSSEAAASGSSTALSEITKVDRLHREKSAELAELSGEYNSLAYRLRDIDERISRRESGIENAASDKEKNKSSCDRLRADAEKLTQDIERLSSESSEAQAKTISSGEAVRIAQDAVTEVKVLVAGAESEKNNADANAQRASVVLNQLRAEMAEKEQELKELFEAAHAAISEEELAEQVAALESNRQKLESDIESLTTRRQSSRVEIDSKEYSLSAVSSDLDSSVDSKAAMDIELGRQDTRLQNWKDKLYEDYELTYIHAMDYRKNDFVMSNAVKENREIKNRLAEIGEVNPGSIKDYEETSERYEFLTTEQADVLKSMDDYVKIVAEMDKISKAKFATMFDEVERNFDATFKQLFGGGKAELSLADTEDPLESEIIVKVEPPGKKSIGTSGGEETMIAISLMFAILKAKPSPFCVLDEIDAPLDESNIQRFADYLESFSDTQFALVTHSRSTMEYADTLFGVTMQEPGITTVLSLMLGEKDTEDFAKTLS